MFGRSIKLFSIFDFEVKIDLSWLIILALVIWSLAGIVFPGEFPNLHWSAYLLMGLAGALGLFSSIIFHELCHSLVARRYGLPMKGITLFMFGGVAEMSDEPPSPKAEFLMAAAGPAASVLVAALFFGAYMLGASVGWPGELSAVLRWIAFINIVLVAFNLIPGFPLDGGRMLRATLWHFKHDLRSATQWASRVGAGFAWFLIGMGVLSLLMGAAIGGLWWILIGLFLRGAARQGYRQVIIRQALQGEPVRRFMNTEPVTVSSDLDIQQLVEDYIYKYHFKMFPVVDDGRLSGCVNTAQVKDVPQERWASTLVRDINHSCGAGNSIGPEDDAVHALSKMNSSQSSRLLVVEGDRLVGIISLKDLLKFLSLKMELEPGRPSGTLGGPVSRGIAPPATPIGEGPGPDADQGEPSAQHGRDQRDKRDHNAA
jgi:Zn-dependent protease/predicted transcriptional regulator